MKKYNCKKHKKSRKSDNKNRKTCNPNPYSDAVIPPCAKYLKNDNALLLNGDLIYLNNNKIYAFISSSANNQGFKGDSNETLNTNIEISMTTFIIGLFINQIQSGSIEYDENKPIHQDKKIDVLIHQLLRESFDKSNSNKNSQEGGIAECNKIEYSLNFIISNGNAIVNFITYAVNITELNYIILFTINRLEGDPGLYFPNNSYAMPIPANLYLAGLNVKFGEK